MLCRSYGGSHCNLAVFILRADPPIRTITEFQVECTRSSAELRVRRRLFENIR